MFSFFLLLLLLLRRLLLLPLALQPTVGFGLSNKALPFFSYLLPTLSIFSLPALEDLFRLPLSIFSPSSRPFQFLSGGLFGHPILLHSSPCDLTSLYFALLSTLLYFLLSSSLLVFGKSFFTYKNMYQFECTEQKAQGSTDDHRSPQHCRSSIWNCRVLRI